MMFFRPKFALNAIKKKLTSPNPHTAMFSLLVSIFKEKTIFFLK